MATTKQTYDEIIQAKETKSSLDGLTPNPETSDQFVDDISSGSKVAVWRHLFWLCAEAITKISEAVALHKADVEKQIDERLAPTSLWLKEQVLLWQYGYALTAFGTQYNYAVVDEAARLVKQCSVVDGENRVTFKVAKGDPLEKLAAAELNSLQQYIKQRRPPGMKFVLISEDGDLLKLDIGVYVDTSLINLNGELISDPSIRPIDDAINSYITTFSEGDFDGTFRTQKLIDEIQSVEGVIDVDPRSVEYKYGEFDYAEVPVFYRSYSGYVVIDPTYPLTDVNVLEYLEG